MQRPVRERVAMIWNVGMRASAVGVLIPQAFTQAEKLFHVKGPIVTARLMLDLFAGISALRELTACKVRE